MHARTDRGHRGLVTALAPRCRQAKQVRRGKGLAPNSARATGCTPDHRFDPWLTHSPRPSPVTIPITGLRVPTAARWYGFGIECLAFTRVGP
jgi:hypothetical protein